MKYFVVIVFMLVCSVVWAEEWQAPEYNEKVPNKGWVITEIIRQIEANKKDDTDKKLDQIYSMVTEIKEELSKKQDTIKKIEIDPKDFREMVQATK